MASSFPSRPTMLRRRRASFRQRSSSSFFLRVEKRMEEEKGRPFSEIWVEETEKFPDDLPLGKQDIEAIRTLGKNLGYADKKTQERTILFYLEQTDDSLAFLKKEMESRTKLYRSLGMAAGLFILVLFA